jgi:hypothetical protein
MRREGALILLVVLVLVPLACDRDMAYTPGERAIQARFQGIDVGDTEQEVRAYLGEPICVVYTVEGTQEELEVRCPESSSALTLRPEERSTWPAELPGLPSRRPTFKALIYVDATVSAYYLVDQHGRVESVQIRMT